MQSSFKIDNPEGISPLTQRHDHSSDLPDKAKLPWRYRDRHASRALLEPQTRPILVSGPFT